MTANLSQVGKVVAQRTYLHVTCLNSLDAVTRRQIEKACSHASIIAGEHFNVVRFDGDLSHIALLQYPDFFDLPFPELKESWSVDFAAGQARYRTYTDSLNPPILHRKELLLPESHPRLPEYAELTAAAESIGLFDEPTRIGFREQWYGLILEKGYKVVGHQLVPVGNDESTGDLPVDEELLLPRSAPAVARHLTALVRNGFSAPIQTLARYGFLDGQRAVFDYGCGRGDDVRGLTENGIPATGWDPHYAADLPITPANIVNLGFVINVIENMSERVTALHRAYELAQELLVVSVMLANQNAVEGQRFNDGVLTRRSTFQKYYTQSELKKFIEQILNEEPIAVGPGIFYVFRDKDAEQRFLTERYRSRRNLLRHSPRPYVERAPRVRPDRAEERYLAYQGALDRLWELWATLGRKPDKAEVQDLLPLTKGFGTLNKALRFIAGRNSPQVIEDARTARIGDLEVYFALNQFEKRRPYKHLESALQRDIQAFFGDYATAQIEARNLLFKIAEPGAIDAACRLAAEHGIGWLIDSESLQLHTSLVEQLPPLLRIYVGCAAILYGDYRNADLVKIHIRSGKLSLMKYDDFAGQSLPRMIERVKINLRKQGFDYFGYGEEYEPPFLYHKSHYINEEFPNYPEQVAFDDALEKLCRLDLSGYGPQPAELAQALENHRWAIDGFKLVRSRTIPELDAPCGRYLTYRDLIECGETQQRTGIANLPKELDTWNALYDLSANVLDPVIDYFGMIKLTYGLCSPELGKHITRSIAHKLDQHASFERKRNGQYVCDRLGAAADFIVEDEDMEEVARWLIENTAFDRLYFYGKDRPVHVSFSSNPTQQSYKVIETNPRRSRPVAFP